MSIGYGFWTIFRSEVKIADSKDDYSSDNGDKYISDLEEISIVPIQSGISFVEEGKMMSEE